MEYARILQSSEMLGDALGMDVRIRYERPHWIATAYARRASTFTRIPVKEAFTMDDIVGALMQLGTDFGYHLVNGSWELRG